MIANLFITKQYIGFDLDDTLHEYRKASRKANNAVFHYIATIHSHLASFQSLSHAYKKILDTHTADAFKDGRTSYEYRRERFEALLKSQRIPYDDHWLHELVDFYKETLKHCLELKKGAKELLEAARIHGKNVILVTEGPLDAQIWTLEILGLNKLVQRIFTPGECGKSKTDGLFQHVLESLDIEPHQMIFIGDKIERDIIPAKEFGIETILFDESSNNLLKDCAPDFFETNSLLDIANEINATRRVQQTSPPDTPKRSRRATLPFRFAALQITPP
jgi:HAD superfamily hydrolase (TIGR01549 family)